MVCLGVGLFEFICASWTCMSISFSGLGKFSVIILSRMWKLLALSFPSGNPTMQMLVGLKFFQRLLILFLLFWILFFCCFNWVISASLSSNSHFDHLLHALHSNVFSFQLVYFSFPTGSFLFSISVFVSYAIVEVLTKFIYSAPTFIEHPYNQCFELCI